MVRKFPLYHPPTPWDGSSNRFQASVKAQAGNVSIDLNNVYPSTIISCGKAREAGSLSLLYGENPLKSSFRLLLLEFALINVLTRIIRVLLKPLKQPRIVSDGGIFIGPSILGHSEKFTSVMFPKKLTIHSEKYWINWIQLIYFFLSGVKMDVSLVKKANKKQLCIAFAGMLLPFLLISIVAFSLRKSMDKELARISSLGFICSGLALPLFPVIHSILKELNLLNSEIGRLALSISVISDAIGVCIIILFEAAKQGEGNHLAVIWYLISLVVFWPSLSLLRVAEITPEGQPVDQTYVLAILLGVLVMGCLADISGMAIANGAFWLGLAIPDGPPLGSTIVERSELVIVDVLMPFAFAMVGLYVDVNSMSYVGWSSESLVNVRHWNVYERNVIWTYKKHKDHVKWQLILSHPDLGSITSWTRLRCSTILFTLGLDHALTVLFLGTHNFPVGHPSCDWNSHENFPVSHPSYDCSRPISLNFEVPTEPEASELPKGEPPNTLLEISNLPEISNPTLSTPLSIFSLHLIDLVGRASLVLIDHEKQEEHNSKYAVCHTIHNVLKQSKVKIVRNVVRSVNSNVLAHAPCSVGVLVDKGYVIHNQLALRNTELHLSCYIWAEQILGRHCVM
ncbi:hypothetical protein DVH24_041731 [Malus domestica]|uniref:Cation/H+ exchanger transmembrane domain-containing protein n=1 Tax=Malus domestica TaxID=3750 RepID=A0A498IUC6_MALDO|nr:hypothetical protein DVH24_041731 [Malus domestica]